MAANLSSMFAQLNNTINATPQGEGLMDSMSMNAGNLIGLGQNSRASYQEDPVNPMAYMNDGGQAMAAKQQLGALDLNTVDGMQTAAQIYQQMGDPKTAMEFMARADAKKAAQMKQLEANQAEMNAEVARKGAIKHALQTGDKVGHAALKSGSVKAPDYMKDKLTEATVIRKEGRETATDQATAISEEEAAIREEGRQEARDVQQEKRVAAQEVDTYEAKKGVDAKYPDPYKAQTDAGQYAQDQGFTHGTPEFKQAMKDYNANQIAINGGADLSVKMQGVLVDTQDASRDAAVKANQFDYLADEVTKNPSVAGAIGNTNTWLKEALGIDDPAVSVKKMYIGMRNSEVMNNLPPGAASDPDVQLALSGFLKDTATPKQIASWARGMSKLQRAESDYQRLKARLIAKQGHSGGLLDAWDARNDEIAAQNAAVADSVEAGAGGAVGTYNPKTGKVEYNAAN